MSEQYYLDEIARLHMLLREEILTSKKYKHDVEEKKRIIDALQADIVRLLICNDFTMNQTIN